MTIMHGPQTVAADALHQEKYRNKGESFREAMSRVASPLSYSDDHFHDLRELLLDQRFLPAGRIQSAIGSSKAVTAYNCFVSGTIEDSFTDGSGSIMQRAAEAATTMRMGGGIGYDFSTLRPRGATIKKLDSISSGAVSFMHIFDAVGLATASSGHRRGAQMGVLRVDHPDIEEFVRAKQNHDKLTGFNISVAVTDKFMQAVRDDTDFNLEFNGTVYRTIRANDLWNMIMRSTYDWAEPGVLFIDRINNQNNLKYCERLAATNPCGEQPLPPYGACLLGSFNLVKYLTKLSPSSPYKFDYGAFHLDIANVVPAMDSVVEVSRYPLFDQEKEALSKRRMGLGVTGLANTIEAIGEPYGSRKFIAIMATILSALRDGAYRASAKLAKERGAFPLYDPKHYLNTPFIRTLPADIQELIERYGIRNSHLLSIAPTGTISMSADNVSSGIEPVFAHQISRPINTPRGVDIVEVQDYGVKFLNIYGKTADQCTVQDHLNVLICANQFVDSAVSKTCNIPQDYSWEKFKNVYTQAWENGCKGCTTFRNGGLKTALLVKKEDKEPETLIPIEIPDGIEEGTPILIGNPSCTFDPATGRKSCE